MGDDPRVEENLTDTDALVGESTTLVVAPIKISDPDGALIRVMAAVPR